MNLFRSLIQGAFLLGLNGSLALAEPLPPLDLKLNPDVIQPLALHPDVDLLLVFPDPVTLITGQGLTSGETPGKVQFLAGKDNPGIVTLRQLDSKASVLMKVVVKKQVFVFRLSESETPQTVVRFSWDPEKNPARNKAHEISKQDAESRKIPVSTERLKQMADLVGQEPKLRAKLPEEYSNYESLKTNFSSEKVNGVTFYAHRIARFSEEDTLIIFGSLKNDRSTSYRHSPKLARIKVGEDRVFNKVTLLQSRQSTPSGGTSFVWVALVGDGNGEPLHLSLKNKFSIQLHP